VLVEVAGDEAMLAAPSVAVAAHASVERRGGTFQLLPHAGLAPVIGAIEAAGACIARVEARGATLETAFLALTGHGLRDPS
jgi:hypothetical protein